MKYMIMTFGSTSELEGTSPEWIKEMIGFMQRIDVGLTESGELVFPAGARRPEPSQDGQGPAGCARRHRRAVRRARESLVGFWVVDVENEARAVEVAAQISGAADAPIEAP